MKRSPGDPKGELSRLFGDLENEVDRPKDPFGGEEADTTAPARVRASLVRLRRLRAQTGAEGLTPAGTRTLLDELVNSLEAIQEALEPRAPTSDRIEVDPNDNPSPG
jgi:hypothetical protein